jgi:hypothetical protein
VKRLLFAALISAIWLTGCRGINRTYLDRATALSSDITAAGQRLSDARSRYQALARSSDFAPLQKYAEREEWAASFSRAENSLEKLRSLRRTSINPIVSQNDPKREAELARLLREASQLLEDVRKQSLYPGERASALLLLQDQGPARVAGANLLTQDLLKRSPTFLQSAQKAAAAYPAKAVDLQKRGALLSASVDNARAQLQRAQAELAKKDKDLLVLEGSLVANKAAVDEGSRVIDEITLRVNQLSRSYSKTLVDMRVQQFVTVGRSSWNERSDSDTESTYYYPQILVTPSLAEDLERMGDRPIDAGFAARIGLDVYENRPPDHDSAEFWIEDSGERYHHKYDVLENGVRTRTAWLPVSEALFEKYEDDLGMDILVKPFGQYEDEALNVATPPGLAFVGNPHYGRWVSDGSGGSYWKWLAAYAFFDSMFGGNRYYQRDWQYWNANFRGRAPWYGRRPEDREDEENRYGSNSGRVARSFANTDWFRSGGYGRQDSSVRGSGPSFRGGGPGGRGK